MFHEPQSLLSSPRLNSQTVLECVSRTAVLKSSHVSLLNQTVEDLSDLFRALLRVTLLAALVVNKGDTEARLISLSPFKVAAQLR